MFAQFISSMKQKQTESRFFEFRFFFLIFRFAKLLLRLPALRSIGLKCAEHHFFFKLVTEDRSMFEMDEQVQINCISNQFNLI